MSKLVEVNIKEINAVKKDLSTIKLKIAFCYPNIYRAGMASLGLQLIYQLWNSYEEVACERSFLPIKEIVEPYTLESDRPLREMDVIAFTMQYEDDYTNILRILERSHIPLETKERDERHPLIIAGGPCAQSNPVPMAPFMDAFMVGDLEPVNDQLIKEGLLEQTSRENRLKTLDSFDWIWVPSLTRDKTVRFAPKGDINDYFYPTKQIIPQLEEDDPWYGAFGKTFMLEVVRGCNRGCSFCLTGKINRPRRGRTLQKLQELYREGVKECQVNKISTIGSGISDYKDLEKLCQSIIDDELIFSLPAIRADRITENLVNLLVQSGQKTITTAPEAGTEELRKQICKEVSDQEIYDAMTIANNGGLSRVKTYFILGLPEETENDVKAIANLGENISSRNKRIRKIRLSAGYFIPKPRTVYQDQSIFPLNELQARGKLLMKLTKKIPKVECEIANPKWARIQTILSLSGEEISMPLKLVAKLGGGLGDWRRALNEFNLKIEDLAEKREKLTEYPWDFIKLE
ncbi:MAG: radical SAM protein [Candidatus Heimdallarchaeota archaeon]|nr:radical SAM protein [Candidatus Heimdallarchaeota archaeon]